MSNINLSELIAKEDGSSSEPSLNCCECSNCGWFGYVSECETVWESEGWEYPKYQVQLCPDCEDGGCIDNYYPEEYLYVYDEQTGVYQRASFFHRTYFKLVFLLKMRLSRLQKSLVKMVHR